MNFFFGLRPNSGEDPGNKPPWELPPIDPELPLWAQQGKREETRKDQLEHWCGGIFSWCYLAVIVLFAIAVVSFLSSVTTAILDVVRISVPPKWHTHYWILAQIYKAGCALVACLGITVWTKVYTFSRINKAWICVIYLLMVLSPVLGAEKTTKVSFSSVLESQKSFCALPPGSKLEDGLWCEINPKYEFSKLLENGFSDEKALPTHGAKVLQCKSEAFVIPNYGKNASYMDGMKEVMVIGDHLFGLKRENGKVKAESLEVACATFGNEYVCENSERKEDQVVDNVSVIVEYESDDCEYKVFEKEIPYTLSVNMMDIFMVPKRTYEKMRKGGDKTLVENVSVKAKLKKVMSKVRVPRVLTDFELSHQFLRNPTIENAMEWNREASLIFRMTILMPIAVMCCIIAAFCGMCIGVCGLSGLVVSGVRRFYKLISWFICVPSFLLMVLAKILVLRYVSDVSLAEACETYILVFGTLITMARPPGCVAAIHSLVRQTKEKVSVYVQSRRRGVNTGGEGTSEDCRGTSLQQEHDSERVESAMTSGAWTLFEWNLTIALFPMLVAAYVFKHMCFYLLGVKTRKGSRTDRIMPFLWFNTKIFYFLWVCGVIASFALTTELVSTIAESFGIEFETPTLTPMWQTLVAFFWNYGMRGTLSGAVWSMDPWAFMEYIGSRVIGVVCAPIVAGICYLWALQILTVLQGFNLVGVILNAAFGFSYRSAITSAAYQPTLSIGMVFFGMVLVAFSVKVLAAIFSQYENPSIEKMGHYFHRHSHTYIQRYKINGTVFDFDTGLQVSSLRPDSSRMESCEMVKNLLDKFSEMVEPMTAQDFLKGYNEREGKVAMWSKNLKERMVAMNKQVPMHVAYCCPRVKLGTDWQAHGRAIAINIVKAALLALVIALWIGLLMVPVLVKMDNEVKERTDFGWHKSETFTYFLKKYPCDESGDIQVPGTKQEAIYCLEQTWNFVVPLAERFARTFFHTIEMNMTVLDFEMIAELKNLYCDDGSRKGTANPTVDKGMFTAQLNEQVHRRCRQKVKEVYQTLHGLNAIYSLGYVMILFFLCMMPVYAHACVTTRYKVKKLFEFRANLLRKSVRPVDADFERIQFKKSDSDIVIARNMPHNSLFVRTWNNGKAYCGGATVFMSRNTAKYYAVMPGHLAVNAIDSEEKMIEFESPRGHKLTVDVRDRVPKAIERDLACLELTKTEVQTMHGLKITKSKPIARNRSQYVKAFGWDGTHCYEAVGRLQFGQEFGVERYFASTKKGFCGFPVCIGETPIAVHISGENIRNSGNIGFNVSYIQVLIDIMSRDPEKFRIPVVNSPQPDWAYLEKYFKTFSQDARNRLFGAPPESKPFANESPRELEQLFDSPPGRKTFSKKRVEAVCGRVEQQGGGPAGPSPLRLDEKTIEELQEHYEVNQSGEYAVLKSKKDGRYVYGVFENPEFDYPEEWKAWHEDGGKQVFRRMEAREERPARVKRSTVEEKFGFASPNPFFGQVPTTDQVSNYIANLAVDQFECLKEKEDLPTRCVDVCAGTGAIGTRVKADEHVFIDVDPTLKEQCVSNVESEEITGVRRYDYTQDVFEPTYNPPVKDRGFNTVLVSNPPFPHQLPNPAHFFTSIQKWVRRARAGSIVLPFHGYCRREVIELVSRDYADKKFHVSPVFNMPIPKSAEWHKKTEGDIDCFVLSWAPESVEYTTGIEVEERPFCRLEAGRVKVPFRFSKMDFMSGNIGLSAMKEQMDQQIAKIQEECEEMRKSEAKQQRPDEVVPEEVDDYQRVNEIQEEVLEVTEEVEQVRAGNRECLLEEQRCRDQRKEYSEKEMELKTDLKVLKSKLVSACEHMQDVRRLRNEYKRRQQGLRSTVKSMVKQINILSGELSEMLSYQTKVGVVAERISGLQNQVDDGCSRAVFEKQLEQLKPHLLKFSEEVQAVMWSVIAKIQEQLSDPIEMYYVDLGRCHCNRITKVDGNNLCKHCVKHVKRCSECGLSYQGNESTWCCDTCMVRAYNNWSVEEGRCWRCSATAGLVQGQCVVCRTKHEELTCDECGVEIGQCMCTWYKRLKTECEKDQKRHDLLFPKEGEPDEESCPFVFNLEEADTILEEMSAENSDEEECSVETAVEIKVEAEVYDLENSNEEKSDQKHTEGLQNLSTESETTFCQNLEETLSAKFAREKEQMKAELKEDRDQLARERMEMFGSFKEMMKTTMEYMNEQLHRMRNDLLMSVKEDSEKKHDEAMNDIKEYVYDQLTSVQPEREESPVCKEGEVPVVSETEQLVTSLNNCTRVLTEMAPEACKVEKCGAPAALNSERCYAHINKVVCEECKISFYTSLDGVKVCPSCVGELCSNRKQQQQDEMTSQEEEEGPPEVECLLRGGKSQSPPKNESEQQLSEQEGSEKQLPGLEQELKWTCGVCEKVFVSVNGYAPPVCADCVQGILRRRLPQQLQQVPVGILKRKLPQQQTQQQLQQAPVKVVVVKVPKEQKTATKKESKLDKNGLCWRHRRFSNYASKCEHAECKFDKQEVAEVVTAPKQADQEVSAPEQVAVQRAAKTGWCEKHSQHGERAWFCSNVKCTYPLIDGMCWRHAKFGAKAFKCESKECKFQAENAERAQTNCTAEVVKPVKPDAKSACWCHQNFGEESDRCEGSHCSFWECPKMQGRCWPHKRFGAKSTKCNGNCTFERTQVIEVAPVRVLQRGEVVVPKQAEKSPLEVRLQTLSKPAREQARKFEICQNCGQDLKKRGEASKSWFPDDQENHDKNQCIAKKRCIDCQLFGLCHCRIFKMRNRLDWGVKLTRKNIVDKPCVEGECRKVGECQHKTMKFERKMSPILPLRKFLEENAITPEMQRTDVVKPELVDIPQALKERGVVALVRKSTGGHVFLDTQKVSDEQLRSENVQVAVLADRGEGGTVFVVPKEQGFEHEGKEARVISKPVEFASQKALNQEARTESRAMQSVPEMEVKKATVAKASSMISIPEEGIEEEKSNTNSEILWLDLAQHCVKQAARQTRT